MFGRSDAGVKLYLHLQKENVCVRHLLSFWLLVDISFLTWAVKLARVL